MVLAAGLGTRLLPLTRETAKPAIPFANRPLIHYSLDWLVENGIEEAVINLHYQSQSILRALKQGSWPLRIQLSHETSLLGTAGGLKKAERHFAEDTFVMVNSDSLFTADLSGPLAYHREMGAVATMVIRKRCSEGAYGNVILDEAGRIVRIAPRGMSQPEGKSYIFTGLHLLEPEVLENIPPDVPYEINQMVYPRLIREGREVRGFVTDSFWAEVGSHETYLQAHRDYLLQGPADILGESSFTDRAEFVPPVLMGAGSEVETGAQIGPMAVVGHHCRIGRGAVIEDSVLWDDVVMGGGAHIRSSIVGHKSHIDPGTCLEKMVVCGLERKRFG